MNIKKRVLRNSIIQNSLALLATIYIYIVKITSKIEYENLAIKIATNSKVLKNIKNKIKRNKFNKPLFNTKLYTSNLELAYKKIYKNYHSNLSIKNIEIK